MSRNPAPPLPNAMRQVNAALVQDVSALRTRLQAAEDEIRDLRGEIIELQEQGATMRHTVEGHTLFNEILEAHLEKLEDMSKVMLSAVDVDVDGLVMAAEGNTTEGGVENNALIEDDSKDVKVSFSIELLVE